MSLVSAADGGQTRGTSARRKAIERLVAIALALCRSPERRRLEKVGRLFGSWEPMGSPRSRNAWAVGETATCYRRQR